MTPPREPYLDDDGRIVIQDPDVGRFGVDEPDPAAWAEPRFLTGVQNGWHAVSASTIRPCCGMLGWAACGQIVRVAKDEHQPYDATAYPVRYKPCHLCAWTVAAATGTLDAALARLADPVARAAAEAFLSSTAFGEGDRDHPGLLQLLAAVSDHAPAGLVSEECRDGDCEHEGECPVTLACPACSLQAGGWAGEWEGTYREECTIPAPCAVLLALAESAKRAVPEAVTAHA